MVRNGRKVRLVRASSGNSKHSTGPWHYAHPCAQATRFLSGNDCEAHEHGAPKTHTAVQGQVGLNGTLAHIPLAVNAMQCNAMNQTEKKCARPFIHANGHAPDTNTNGRSKGHWTGRSYSRGAMIRTSQSGQVDLLSWTAPPILRGQSPHGLHCPRTFVDERKYEVKAQSVSQAKPQVNSKVNGKNAVMRFVRVCSPLPSLQMSQEHICMQTGRIIGNNRSLVPLAHPPPHFCVRYGLFARVKGVFRVSAFRLGPTQKGSFTHAQGLPQKGGRPSVVSDAPTVWHSHASPPNALVFGSLSGAWHVRSHARGSSHHPPGPQGMAALEGKRPQRRLDRRLEEVAKRVGGSYCRLQMPLNPALGVSRTVAGQRLGALEGGSPLSNASVPQGLRHPPKAVPQGVSRHTRRRYFSHHSAQSRAGSYRGVGSRSSAAQRSFRPSARSSCQSRTRTTGSRSSDCGSKVWGTTGTRPR